mmetsp:Transcript_30910/g.68256  ORF Transcript_30910/g.68256 Transcript_30910/m.68256 type:complete len:243 (-) Transcript_30910:648-1376(-)
MMVAWGSSALLDMLGTLDELDGLDGLDAPDCKDACLLALPPMNTESILSLLRIENVAPLLPVLLLVAVLPALPFAFCVGSASPNCATDPVEVIGEAGTFSIAEAGSRYSAASCNTLRARDRSAGCTDRCRPADGEDAEAEAPSPPCPRGFLPRASEVGASGDLSASLQGFSRVIRRSSCATLVSSPLSPEMAIISSSGANCCGCDRLRRSSLRAALLIWCGMPPSSLCSPVSCSFSCSTRGA